jgi:hypothetical protein
MLSHAPNSVTYTQHTYVQSTTTNYVPSSIYTPTSATTAPTATVLPISQLPSYTSAYNPVSNYPQNKFYNSPKNY